MRVIEVNLGTERIRFFSQLHRRLRHVLPYLMGKKLALHAVLFFPSKRLTSLQNPTGPLGTAGIHLATDLAECCGIHCERKPQRRAIIVNRAIIDEISVCSLILHHFNYLILLIVSYCPHLSNNIYHCLCCNKLMTACALFDKSIRTYLHH